MGGDKGMKKRSREGADRRVCVAGLVEGGRQVRVMMGAERNVPTVMGHRFDT